MRAVAEAVGMSKLKHARTVAAMKSAIRNMTGEVCSVSLLLDIEVDEGSDENERRRKLAAFRRACRRVRGCPARFRCPVHKLLLTCVNISTGHVQAESLKRTAAPDAESGRS